MNIKLFELRDRSTFIPVFAIRPRPTRGPDVYQFRAEKYLLARSGFGPEGETDHIILGRLECSGIERNCTYDPFAWGDPRLARTFNVAHRYIVHNWDALKSGDVIDVEFILGETTKPKESERAENPET